MEKNESMKDLEGWKDYVNLHDNDVVVIDRAEDITNRGFEGREYKNYLSCSTHSNWREATKEEVIEAFEKHLNHRFGEDWKTMKIKERHPSLPSYLDINDGSWEVEISKEYDGWNVWNKNGLLYCEGIWVERLEEPENKKNMKNEKLSSDYYGLDWEKIHIKEAIKENTVIHCETEEEAERILGMAHELGHKWYMGGSFKDYNYWDTHEDETCYNLSSGSYCYYDYCEKHDYTIIPSTQIADLEPEKSTDWTPTPEDIEVMNKKEKASETQIGGSHYSDMAIQPVEFIHKNNLSFIQGNIIKYVCKYKSKGGIEDLNKAKHFIDLLIELEEE